MKQEIMKAVLVGMIWVMTGCQGTTSTSDAVQFKVNTAQWMAADPEGVKATHHYGLVVVDTTAMEKVYENLTVAPKAPINFPLIPNRTYFMVLIAYDQESRVLNFVEKEFEI